MAVTQAQRRRAAGLNALLVSIAAVGIAAFSLDVAADHRLRLDLSADQHAMLAPETRDVLKRLAEGTDHVTVTAFSSQRKDNEAELRDRALRDTLHELALGNPNVQTLWVDFDAEPAIAEGLGVERYGTVVVTSGVRRVDIADRELFRSSEVNGRRRVEFIGEAALSRALTRVSLDEPRKIYLSTGHGERRRDDSGPTGISAWLAGLNADGYDIAVWGDSAATLPGATYAVPDDADVLLVVGPTGPWLPEEEDAVKAYLQRGGRVGYFVDPGGFVAGFVEGAGITVPSGSVRDVRYYPPDERRPQLQLRPHAITEMLLEAGLAPIVRDSSSVVAEPGVDRAFAPLLVTSDAGWVERGSESPAIYDAADGLGPVVVAVAGTVGAPDSPAARIAVVGDVDIVTSELLAQGAGNAALARNLVQWLVGDNPLGAVAPQEPLRRVVMSRDDVVWLGCVLVLGVPTLCLAIGAFIGWRRHHR